METQSDLAGYVSRNWKKKTVSGFRSRATEAQEKAGGGWQASVIVGYCVATWSRRPHLDNELSSEQHSAFHSTGQNIENYFYT